MDTNLFLFYLYIIIILLFLLLLSYLISLEIFDTFYSIIFLNKNKNLNYVDEMILLYFFDTYVKRKKWFLSISMLEFCYSQNFLDPSTISNRLAYCYSELSYLSISEFYYLNALFYSPSNIVILKNLIKLYNKLKNYTKVEEMNQRILNLNSSNDPL